LALIHGAVNPRIVQTTADYYRGHIAACKNIWPQVRHRHEYWLKETFGKEVADQIMFLVKDWNRNEFTYK
jgi:hypothetical protein